MHSELLKLFNEMWLDYCKICPSALKIYESFTNLGNKVLNDHIALRTFNTKELGVDILAKHFTKYGYQEKGQYTFTEKKLFAKHYEHQDKSLPKIFISELELEKMSRSTQDILNALIKNLDINKIPQPEFLFSGRSWNLDHKTYLKLAEESEYASWVAAYGFRPNHFTVNINDLKTHPDIESVNKHIESLGFVLNSSGGKIKGTPDLFLEQSSIMAEKVKVTFSDGVFDIPGCYYEFAKRYKLPDGKLYHGFVTQSADKIFESTNRI